DPARQRGGQRLAVGVSGGQKTTHRTMGVPAESVDELSTAMMARRTTVREGKAPDQRVLRGNASARGGALPTAKFVDMGHTRRFQPPGKCGLEPAVMTNKRYTTGKIFLSVLPRPPHI